MIQVVLITRTGKAYLANGIAAFTLDKEAYTLQPADGDGVREFQHTAVRRHLSGTAAAGRHGTALRDSGKVPAGAGKRHLLCAVFSRGLTALLLQNQLEPGLHTAMSLDKLMQDFVTFPKEITWESDTDTSNYLFVKESTSMWDGVANLTYKLCGRYPLCTMPTKFACTCRKHTGIFMWVQTHCWAWA